MNQRPEIKPGTMIQWITDGTYFFDEPQKVCEVVESKEGTFALVIGSDVGIPIEQAVDVEWEAKMEKYKKNMKILLFGAPGAGKGTAAGWLSQKLGIEHISTGDIIREHIHNQTELGKAAETFISKGQLVPDGLMIDLVENIIANKAGYILDGYPRSELQARYLMKVMTPSGVIYLQVPDEVAIERLMRRGRDDDNEDTIKERLVVYKKQTLPVLGYLGIFSNIRHWDIDGSGTIDETRKKIESAIIEFMGEC